MATPWGLTCLLIGLSIVEMCNTHPMEQVLSGNEGPNGQIMGALVAVMVSVCIVFTLLACVCCKRRSGFKENENENEKKVFRNSPVSASVINETSLSGEDPGHVNPIANAEFTIFTPLSPPHHNNNVFRSQPPVICYTENEANPEFNKVINPQIDGFDVSEWFAETEYNFPRNCLKYTRELGPGWFGRVVEGEALGISSPNTWTPVAVRILESSASAHEQAQFLLEAAVYRTEAHPHVLRLLGRSLEATPLLLIQELCPKGDLKRFLMENKELRDSEIMVGVPLRYCTQLAAAIQWLHEHNLPHLDLAARTCQISPDLSLKLGDYGLAVSHYPNDYYQGTPSIPVRWCAPESVNHTNTTLQPKQVTLEANIWSLAVTFWEICEWGRMPYDWLTDDEVISQVMDAPNVRLPQPSFNAYYIPPLYRLMEYCWLPSLNRPQINQIYSMLIHLSKTYTSSPTTSRSTADFSTENFDIRWESFKPNTIIKTDNTRIKSASLRNLHGSFENLTEISEENETNNTVIQMDSWLENVASHTDDMQYVRGLSEAIHELDTALASEQTSSSSSFEPTPLSSLGAARSENILHMDDSNLDSLIFPKRSESGSETEDETWKRRIERGAYSEKVRQKSKSVADLMVLTHIDMNTVRDIFQEELKKLQEERRESLLFVPVQSSEQKIETSSNQSLEIDIASLTEPSIHDSKLEQIISDTQINLEGDNTNQENRHNFDTILQSNIESNTILTQEQNVANNQNILNNKVPDITLTETQKSTEKNVEHIEIVSVPKKLVQDFINNERRCEHSPQIPTEIDAANVSQIENIQSKNTNLEAAPTEKLQSLQDKIEESKLESEISDINKDLDNKDKENIAVQVNEILQQAEKSVILQQSEYEPKQKLNSEINENITVQINEEKKSVSFLEPQQILSNEDKGIISSQVDEILKNAEKTAQFIYESNEQKLQQNLDNTDKENISSQKSVSFIEPSNIKYDDTKTEENIVHQEIIHNTEQAKKSVTFLELTTNEVVNSEEITREQLVAQQNLSREDKEEITSQVNEMLQEAEDSVNNRLHKNVIESPVKEIKRIHKENDKNGPNTMNEDVKKITHDFLSNEQQYQNKNKLSDTNTNLISVNKIELIEKDENIEQISEVKDLKETQKVVMICDKPKDLLSDETNVIDISPLTFVEELKQPQIQNIETTQQNIESETQNILLQFDDPRTESTEILVDENKTQLTEDIECSTISGEIMLPVEILPVENKIQLRENNEYSTKFAEASQENVLTIESTNILLQFGEPTTESNEILTAETKTQLTSDIECPTKSAETSQENIVPIESSNILLQFEEPVTESKEIPAVENKIQLIDDIVSLTKSTDTSPENNVPIESSNVVLQFEEPATESKETLTVEKTTQLTAGVEGSTKSAEFSQENIVPIYSSNILLQFEGPATENKEKPAAENKIQFIDDIVSSTKSAETSQENVEPIESTNILLQFEDYTTESQNISAVGNKSQLIEDIECPRKSAETSQENVLPNETSNILLVFDEPTTESKEMLTEESKTQLTENIGGPSKSTETSQEHVVPVERTNILLQFENPTTESKEIPSVENKTQLREDIVSSTKSAETYQENVLPTEEIKRLHKDNNKNGTNNMNEDVKKITHDFLSNEQQKLPADLKATQKDVMVCDKPKDLLSDDTDVIDISPLTFVEELNQPQIQNIQTAQQNIESVEIPNILLQFDVPTTESKEMLTAETKTQLIANIECTTKSAETKTQLTEDIESPTKSTETSPENTVPIESSNILLQFEDPTTESKEIPAVENRLQLTEDTECPTKSAEVTPIKSAETSPENIVPIESSNILLQFEDPATESKEIPAVENKLQLTEDTECPTKSAEVTPIKSTETSPENIVPIESSNILLQFEDPTTESKEIPAVENKLQLTEDTECPTKSAEVTPIKSAGTSPENMVPIESSNILLQFEDPATESKEISAVKNKTQLTENIPQSISTIDYLNSELYQDSTVMPDLIETLNKEQNLDLSSPLDISLKSSEPIEQDDLITESHINKEIHVKSTEYSTIQNFINNERNNNQEDLIPVPQLETKQETTQPTPVDITADILDLDDSNVQRINQVFNVFSVTVDHKPPLECFSPVKSYLHPFDQNDLMTDINCLLESEKKYESKNIPFVNGITCEVSNKFIDILEDSSQPKKLAEIALDSLKSNIEQYEIKEEKLTNGHDEKAPKKLSELALESFKTNSLSEDSGFASVQCEDKITNGVKEEDTSEDILKISVDSLEDILSNSDDNECEVKDVLVTSFVGEETHAPKKLSELVQDTLNKTYEVSKETHYLPDLILDNMQNKLENGDILINVTDSPVKSLSEKEESDKNSPLKLSEIIFDSLPCNSPVTSESTDNFSEKTVIDVNKISDNGDNSDINDEEISFPTSTPFKPKNPETTDNFFSFVSEGDEPSDCQTHVILGPCEEYGLGLYSGLKTTFGKFSDDDRPEEELLQFSSNFMPFTEAENSVDYSLETWDKFLGKSLQDQDNCPSSVFDNFSPRPESLDVFKKNEEKDENLNKTVTIIKNDKTFTIENEAPHSPENKDESQAETTQSSWEPGEGWFLHPQTETDDLTGQIDISTAEIDNSYVGFALDEECENALRNELAAKLPHAQGMSHEEPQEPEDWDTEERSEIIVKYNVYATPLSPIPEESCCDDVYCDQMQHRDGSDSDSDWSEPGLGHTSQLEDILVVDTETHTALILESPSLREPQHRHTPSQDSCCSNDTLFNLEDLNYGLSPQHHGTLSTTHSQDSDHILEIEITEDTPKHTPTKKVEDNSDSTEMNLTYTKPDINIDESESSNLDAIMEIESKPEDTKTKLELKLDPNAIGVAPLPSPEDIPWRQLPASLLTYNEVTQNDKFGQESEETTENIEENNIAEEITNEDLSDRDCTIEADLYSNLTDIRFSGPCDAQLMSTSFSEDAEERDWDSGSDTRSSSSGEFIWKEGEHEESLRALHAASHDVSVMEEINPMDAIDEENSNTSDSDDCEEDEIEETEFVPSAWDAQATPTKSALRSPEKSNKRKNQQKGVWFKKQKYHCVYEYPREPESPVPPGDLWRPLSDLSNFTDWELDPDSCIAPSYDDPDGAYDVLDKFITRSGFPLASGSSRHRDLYQLNPFPDFGPCIAASDEDFFISSSARPFQSVGQSSQFFPGQQPPKSKFMWQDYQSSSQQSSRDLSEGITPDSGIDDITPASISDIGVEILPRHHMVPPLKCLAAIAADKTRKTEEKNVDSSLGGLRHTRNRLKLDLPPSPNSFTSTRTFSIDVNNDPVVNREIPTFSTFGKTRFSVQHVSTPTEEIPDPLQPGKSKCKNVSFEALPHKPMKLTEKVYIMDNPEEENHKPVEMVQGEASLLDSADEDSGIESSANATLERHQQQILN